MAFANKIGKVLKQAVSINSSMYQAIRCMSSSKLFVGGLSYATDEHSLRDSFSNYGEIIEARIIMDRESGRSRGFGFVSFTSTEEASAAISGMDGKDLQGRIVRVNYATDRRGGGGGYGGGGYGGGGYGGGGYGGGGGSGGYGGGGSVGYGGGGYGGGGSGGYGGGSGYDGGGGGADNYNMAAGGDGYTGAPGGDSGLGGPNAQQHAGAENTYDQQGGDGYTGAPGGDGGLDGPNAQQHAGGEMKSDFQSENYANRS